VVLPNNTAAAAFMRREVACWDLDSGEELWRTTCPGELAGLAASPDGLRLAVDAVDRGHLLDAVTGEGEWAPAERSYFTFGPDGTLFAYDTDSRTVKAQNPKTERWKETGLEFGEPEEDDCYALCCSPTGKLLASGGNNGRVRLGDLQKGRWVHLIQYPATLVSKLHFTPDGRTLASAHRGTVLFHDPSSAQRIGALTLPLGSRITSLAFSPDGETLAVGDDHGVVRLWPWRRLLDVGR
jgi:WD40 repeat protein